MIYRSQIWRDAGVQAALSDGERGGGLCLSECLGDSRTNHCESWRVKWSGNAQWLGGGVGVGAGALVAGTKERVFMNISCAR